MFLSIIITLVLGSIIGIITSLSVYGFISLVKFLTIFLEILNEILKLLVPYLPTQVNLYFL